MKAANLPHLIKHGGIIFASRSVASTRGGIHDPEKAMAKPPGV
jgi:hypothetical protein